MNYSAIKYCDIANGLGVRTSLFVSGCRRHCKGCFNQEAQNFSAGDPFDDEAHDTLMASLEPDYIAGLSILGGEPLEPENQPALLALVKEVKAAYPTKTIWMYTGELFEDLLDEAYEKHTKDTLSLLEHTDVLVDGPYLEEKKDISLAFRGSSNQRIIDVARTLQTHCVSIIDDL